MNNQKSPENSFFRAFLKSSLESVGSNSKFEETDELVKWFQSATHVETSVDLHLKDIIENTPLLLLSGTPGSGKTQFIKNLGDEFETKGYLKERKGSVLKFTKGEKSIVVKHDATQVDKEENSAAEQLALLLSETWDDENIDKPKANNFFLIGINQGVLMRLFSLPDFKFKKLYKIYLEKTTNKNVKFFNLADRSVIKPDDWERSFINQFLEKFINEKYWEKPPDTSNNFKYQTCYGCELVDKNLCPIYENVKQIRKPEIREKLHEIFTLNYFFPGQIITFRDVLAIISKMIVGYHDHYDKSDLPCDELRKIAASDDFSDTLNLTRLLFYNSIFSSGDVWNSFLSLEKLKGVDKFHGYSGPYFIENKESGCNIHKFDPAQSKADCFRSVDDEIFNEPISFLDKFESEATTALEKILVYHLKKKLDEYEEDLYKKGLKDEAINKRQTLLYCLIMFYRRRTFFYERFPKYESTNYKYAQTYCEIIEKLEKGESEKIQPHAGQVRKALSDLTGIRSKDNLCIRWGSEWDKIETTIQTDVEVKILLKDTQRDKIENKEKTGYYPKSFHFEIRSQADEEELKRKGLKKVIASLPIDIETWESLQLASEGHLKGYSGLIQPKAIEGFLESLRAEIWEYPGNPAIVMEGNVKAEESITAKIKKERESIKLYQIS